jgi:hypothetical protein
LELPQAQHPMVTIAGELVALDREPMQHAVVHEVMAPIPIAIEPLADPEETDDEFQSLHTLPPVLVLAALAGTFMLVIIALLRRLEPPRPTS